MGKILNLKLGIFMEKLFTVEMNNNNESVEIHMNSTGIDTMIEILQSLKRKNQTDHEHLMTDEWGGYHLTSVQQNKDDNVKLINHLKIFLWIKDN